MLRRVHVFARTTFTAFGVIVFVIAFPWFWQGAVALTLHRFWVVMAVAAVFAVRGYWREFHDEEAIRDRITELQDRIYDLSHR